MYADVQSVLKVIASKFLLGEKNKEKTPNIHLLASFSSGYADNFVIKIMLQKCPKKRGELATACCNIPILPTARELLQKFQVGKEGRLKLI